MRARKNNFNGKILVSKSKIVGSTPTSFALLLFFKISYELYKRNDVF